MIEAGTEDVTGLIEASRRIAPPWPLCSPRATRKRYKATSANENKVLFYKTGSHFTG